MLAFDSDPTKSCTAREPAFRPVTPGTTLTTDNSDNSDQPETADNSDGITYATTNSDQPAKADNSAKLTGHDQGPLASAMRLQALLHACDYRQLGVGEVPTKADNSHGLHSVRGAFLPTGVSGIRDLTDAELFAYDDMGTEGAYDALPYDMGTEGAYADLDATDHAFAGPSAFRNLPSTTEYFPSAKEHCDAVENGRRETFRRLGLDPDWPSDGPLRLVPYSVLVENGLLSTKGSATYDDDYAFLLDLGILPGDIPRRGPSQRYSNAIKALEEAQENAKLGQPTVPPTTHGGKAKRASSRRRKQQHRRSRQHGRPPEAAPTKDSPSTEASRPATEMSGEQATSSGMERDNDDARMNNLDGRPSNLNTGHVHDIRGTAFDFAPASPCRPLAPPPEAAMWAMDPEEGPTRTRRPARPTTAPPAEGTPTPDMP